ncbi:MAG TPA: cytochrome C oxidase subunit II [Candidatus Angelobacter sp.]
MALALLLALLLITLISVYLFFVHPWWFPAVVALHGAVLDRQFSTALWVLGGLFVAGQLLLAFSIFRARSKRPVIYSRGNWRFEISWTVLVACLFFWFNITGERVWSEIKIHPAATDPVQVEVTGAQFQWYFRYPGPDGRWGRTDAVKFAKPNEGNPLGIDPDDPAGKDDIVSASLVLPVNRDVDLTLRAQDVIHSVFIPAMRFKQDAVPGMSIHAYLRPLHTGTFEIACSQLCGLGHYRMRATVKVVSEQEFKEWLKLRQSVTE